MSDKKENSKPEPQKYSDESASLIEEAKKVLDTNARDGFTIPAEGLYPHQWLWDSCFIAIGLSNYDTERAQKEITNLLRGQWANGMIPHMILDSGLRYRQDRELWRSYVSPFAPDKVATSGITQPPMLAEAVVRIGQKLKKSERRSWYQDMFPALVKYHEWLFTERDPHEEGLVLQVHPWETGLDNTPPWIYEMHQHQLSWWITLADKLRLDGPLSLLRRDVLHAPPGERLDTIDALAYYSVQRRLRRKSYDINRLLSHSLFAIEDLAYNCIFIRANQHLHDIARAIKRKLPEELENNIKKSEQALEQLWDAYSAQYFSRNFVTHKLIKVSTIATLLPLYSGAITKERAKELVGLLDNRKFFGPKFPVPTVPVNSEWFGAHKYWQGPTWLNTNWLIIDGLRRYGFDKEAEHIAKQSIQLVEKSGFGEYFSPLDGSPAGADNFSWTAALTIDLLKYNQ